MVNRYQELSEMYQQFLIGMNQQQQEKVEGKLNYKKERIKKIKITKKSKKKPINIRERKPCSNAI